DVAAQRVADDDGRRETLGVHERLDVGAKALDREVIRGCLEDGKGERHRPAAGGQSLDGRLPVLTRPEQSVEPHPGSAGPGLDPAESRYRTRLVHAVLPPSFGPWCGFRRRGPASATRAIIAPHHTRRSLRPREEIVTSRLPQRDA